MKKLAVVVLAVGLAVGALAPGAAFADSSTDAALGLGAFAVFNQIIGGTGIFARPGPVVVSPPPVVVTPPPAVVVTPPTYYYYPPSPVYYYPPVYYRVYHRGWCPPGLARQGRCWEAED